MKKSEWSRWFDGLGDDDLSALLAAGRSLPNPGSHYDERFIRALRSSAAAPAAATRNTQATPHGPGQRIMWSLTAAAVCMVIIITGLLILTEQTAPGAEAADRRFQVGELKGNAYVESADTGKILLQDNSPLPEKAAVAVEENASLTLTRGDTVSIQMDGTGAFTIEDTETATRVVLRDGTARFAADYQSVRGDFYVETDMFRLKMTGTEFLVSGGRSGNVVQIDHGELVVSMKYRLTPELNRLKNTNADLAGKAEQMLALSSALKSGQIMHMKRADFIRNEEAIKELLVKLSTPAREEGKNRAADQKTMEELARLTFRNVGEYIPINLDRTEPASERREPEDDTTPPPDPAPTAPVASTLKNPEEPRTTSNGSILSIPREHLVAEWLLAGNADDTSGFGNHGTVRRAQPASDRFGNEAGALYFDGRSSVSINDNNVLRALERGRFCSFSVWIKIERFQSGFFPVFCKYFPSSDWQGGFGYWMDVKNASDQGVRFCSGMYSLGSGEKPATGSWYHIVFVNDRDQGNVRFYINGVLVNSVRAAVPLLTRGGNFYIGYAFSGFDEHAIGVIDDLRIYDTALTPE
ncbi:MAG TPA: hypothetical protein ENN69_01725, partial [Spirochaetia bacterium]|nr:hypothetical protein [Spirochaetia bacterium]